ncbi:hypothetical protein Q4560_01190 [Celeribacter halophilus]|uniref:hypothetical protein n=1 Tax=Celeribacter halophilus TaxID=576117 RepID=UPI0026E1D432|nr:hypothetical protein [Celeribacter halophilus]MDO6721870.1 hypothetical protein [Celeribacter halophilus]
MDELCDDTPIFRIFNFYDLINTLSTGTIRLSQVSRMEDPNELFGVYFDVFRSAFGPQSADHVDQAQAQFRNAQSHYYMTCWTRVSDNIAVWSLYSPQKDAIQVQTTYGRLRKALNEHYNTCPNALAYKLEPNDPTDLFLPPEIGPVNYVDFQEVYSKLKRQCAKYYIEKERYLSSLIESGEDLGKSTSKWADIDGMVRARIFEEPRLGGPLLKDFRYQHEQEMRFVLSLRRRDGRTKEQYEAHPLAGLDEPSRHPRPEDCPPNIFVPFAPSNFTNFQVDGRIEDYKFDAISYALAKFGIEATKSSAFQEFEI